MAPVIQGIADELGHGLGPGLELLAVAAVAGHILLIHAVGAHLTPLIVIAAQPNLCDIVELAVLINLLGIDMAVVIQNRHGLCVLVVQRLRHIGG